MKEICGGPLDGERADWTEAFVVVVLPSQDCFSDPSYYKYAVRVDRYVCLGRCDKPDMFTAIVHPACRHFSHGSFKCDYLTLEGSTTDPAFA